MRKLKYSEGQIIAILKQNEGGVSVPDLCRDHGIRSAQFYN
jgi:putative transposase